MKKMAVFTSGGDAPGMNACIRAVARTALGKGIEILGIRRGYQGMIEGDFYPLLGHSVSDIIHRGGTILGSARSKAFRTSEGRQRAYEKLRESDIEGVIAIGGDGTFTGAHIFGNEYGMPMIGVPGTIDNDLWGTDFTIGYDTAINTAMQAIDRIKDTADAHDRAFFVEVMGRDAGFIAVRTAIATGAEAVLIPETPTNIDELYRSLEDNYLHKQSASIIIVAEGDEAGNAFTIAEKVKQRMPHFEMRVTVLGHIQRGGSPSCMDRVRASRLGIAAVQALIDGEKDIMVGEKHLAVQYTPFEKAIKHHQRVSPKLADMVQVLA